MTPREQGFLLLTSQLGDPGRKPLTVAKFRTLTSRVRGMAAPEEERQLLPGDLMALGYCQQEARQILHLLSDKELLEYYLYRGEKVGCVPLTRVSPGYPAKVRKRLGLDSPGCLWAKGDMSVLEAPCIALVGSRELHEGNRQFAEEAGRQAAQQGYALVSGNARGADSAAQRACLEAGGRVISVVADALQSHKQRENVLYLSEEGYDMAFSTPRALSRNRVIHALGEKTLVAQSGLSGGTWDGTVKNLKLGLSSVFCFDDGSNAARELEQMGAVLIRKEALSDLAGLTQRQTGWFADR